MTQMRGILVRPAETAGRDARLAQRADAGPQTIGADDSAGAEQTARQGTAGSRDDDMTRSHPTKAGFVPDPLRQHSAHA